MLSRANLLRRGGALKRVPRCPPSLALERDDVIVFSFSWHRQRRPNATTTTDANCSSSARGLVPDRRPKRTSSSTKTYFEAFPYKPPRSNLTDILYPDVSPDKFFVEIRDHPSLQSSSSLPHTNSHHELDEKTYKENKLAPGSLAKFKTRGFDDDDYSNRQIGEMLEEGEAASAGMTASLAGNFATIVKRRPLGGRDTWWVREHLSGEEGLKDSANLSLGSRRCVMAFPRISLDDFIDNVRFMWPDRVEREGVAVTVKGEPARETIMARNILGGHVAVSVNGGPAMLCLGDWESAKRMERTGNDALARVVTAFVGSFQKLVFAVFGIGIGGPTLYYIVIEPYFGPFF